MGCHRNYCLKHRHPTDHECQAPAVSSSSRPQGQGPTSRAAQAAIARQQAASSSVQSSSGSSSIRTAAASTTNRIATMFQQQQQRASGQVRGGLSNGRLTEDEALARALQASISDQQSGQDQQITAPQTREEQDRMLALALAESEREANRRPNGSQNSSSQDNTSKSCGIS